MKIKRLSLSFLMLMLIIAGCKTTSDSSDKSGSDEAQVYDYALVIHGGAGTILKENMTPETESAYRSILDSVLTTGQKMLESGADGLDVVVSCIQIMEKSPLFNAGKGAVFTHEGHNELDASIMRGSDLGAGAVAGAKTIKSPIEAARTVMEKSEHVMLSGAGAEEFAEEMGLELVDPSYFYTQRRFDALQRLKEKDEVALDHDEKKGTVGVVVKDKSGHLYAGTSTGGMTNKRWGRIGDSPIIGAGTYADDRTCAVSCTGHGEYFIRNVVAASVSHEMLLAKKNLEDAGNHIVHEVLSPEAGSGGLIAVDHNGQIAMPFNSAGMYRGYVRDGEKYIGIYKNE